MFVYEELTAQELLRVNEVNLDERTVTFTMDFYLSYMRMYDSSCICAKYEDTVIGYIFGNHGKYKVTEEEYSHVTALSVSPFFRKSSLGTFLLKIFEGNSLCNNSNFIDLYVRQSNHPAVSFYRKNGYNVHAVVPMYYADPHEDAYDMRKYIAT
ncbi:N-terminal acetyltransferase B complex catalytic subunit [Nematocida sp. LUAm3]|nr:N-terminal acetyltransferase B complex catalytic subunit [Nematocida sp. LUAm3]KAI5173897.1 N-terminal acetyltransferase B complex catalytic subunit [Nematocida sp. LUAm2]KAI5177358.1 N-terminal acetyltransferase B complex catalytic subunit [Nematocida sp. LUAm1]